MIKLTNRLVQENLYRILNLVGENETNIWIDNEECKLVVRANNTTTNSYPYNTVDKLKEDYNQIIKIKNKLK